MKNILLVILAFQLVSCASIVSDSEYDVNIQSIPTNTEFMIKDEEDNIVATGVTPNIVTLEASDGYFSKAKYNVEYVNEGKKVQKSIEPKIDNWYWGNIFVGHVFGFLLVDPLTGAMYKLPKRVVEDVNTLYVNGTANRRNNNYGHATQMPFNQNININVNVNSDDIKKEEKEEVTKVSQSN